MTSFDDQSGGFGRASAFDPLEDWGPPDSDSWLQQDPLRLEEPEDAAGLRSRLEFDSWVRLPQDLRRLSWREREIAAALRSASLTESVPGAWATGVGIRAIAGRPTVCAVVLTDVEVPRTPHWVRGVPSSLHVPTIVNRDLGVSDRQPETEVPVVVEERPQPYPLGGWTDEDPFFHRSYGSVDHTVLLRSGDPIAGRNQLGFKRPGTLTSHAMADGIDAPLLLGAAHVFGDYHDEIVHDVPGSTTTIARVIRRNDVLDAAVAAIQGNECLDLRLRQPERLPRRPVMLCNGMAVQLYGAKSGHLKGFIDLAYQSPAGGYAYHNRGHIAVRNLGTGPGDSGALLTSGHDTTSPFSPAIARHYAPGYRKHLVCAALGMLVLGPSPTASSVVPADSVFVPIVEVLVALGIDLLCADDGEESP